MAVLAVDFNNSLLNFNAKTAHLCLLFTNAKVSKNIPKQFVV